MPKPPLPAQARLLIIDDEPAVVPIVERFARQLGFTVDYRASATEALALLSVIKPDAAMVDLQMPELSVSTCCGRSGRSIRNAR